MPNTRASRETEKQFMAAVIDLARVLGWKVYHPFDSRRSEPGWPDLVLTKPARPIIFAELKRTGGRVTTAQREWHHALKAAAGPHQMYVWTPDDWPAIEAMLRRR